MRICDFVEEELSHHAPSQAVAAWLTTSYWLIGGKNGDAILFKRDVWLTSDNPRLAEIALQMNEFYIGRDVQQEREVFDLIRNKHPSLTVFFEAIARH